MSDLTLTETRLRNGSWEGLIASARSRASALALRVTHLDRPVVGVELTEDPTAGHWTARIPIPRHAIGDGYRRFRSTTPTPIATSEISHPSTETKLRSMSAVCWKSSSPSRSCPNPTEIRLTFCSSPMARARTKATISLSSSLASPPRHRPLGKHTMRSTITMLAAGVR